LAGAVGDPGRGGSEIARAMEEGARRSLEARGPGGPAPTPAPRPSPGPVAFRESPVGAFLVRHKWKLYGLLFLLVTELCLLTLGTTISRGPG
jgi:hypothetical protein